MIVHIEDMKAHFKYRNRINAASLHDIQFFENGKKLDISKIVIDEFNFIGFNNMDFISTGFYKTDEKEIEHGN